MQKSFKTVEFYEGKKVWAQIRSALDVLLGKTNCCLKVFVGQNNTKLSLDIRIFIAYDIYVLKKGVSNEKIMQNRVIWFRGRQIIFDLFYVYYSHNLPMILALFCI